MISRRVKRGYFDMPSAMMLNERGHARLATLKYNAINQLELNKKIRKVFTLNADDFEYFKIVNNCKK